MLKQIKEAVDFLNLKAKIDSGIDIGIILGTGLGGLVKEIDILLQKNLFFKKHNII